MKNVYEIFNHFNIANLSSQAAEEINQIKRSELILKKVKEIDPDLEVAFIPRTLYELTFLKKCVKEDLKAGTVCPFYTDEFSERDEDKCWHQKKFDDQSSDPQDPYLKNIAYRLNKSLVKEFNPANQTEWNLNTFLSHAEQHIEFFNCYFNPSASFDEQFIENKIQLMESDTFLEQDKKLSAKIATSVLFNRNNKNMHSLAINNERTKEIIKNAIAIESSEQASTSVIFYRSTSNYEQDQPFRKGNAYSLSFGTSLFAGAINDVGASVFRYAREEKKVTYVLLLSSKDLVKDKVIDIPMGNGLTQLYSRGEFFHARSKISEITNPIFGINAFLDNDELGFILSDLPKQQFLDNFEKYKKEAHFI